MRHFRWLMKLSRWRWASSLKMIFFAKSTFTFVCSSSQLVWSLCYAWFVGKSCWVNWASDVCRCKSLVKIPLRVTVLMSISFARWRNDIFRLYAAHSRTTITFCYERPLQARVVCNRSLPSNFSIIFFTLDKLRTFFRPNNGRTLRTFYHFEQNF